MKVILFVGLLMSMLFGQVLYEEYFTGGVMQLDWHPWFTDTAGLGDSMQVINDPTTPGGDDWAGRISNEYMSVAGLTYAGESDLTDYSIEAWIYTVVVPSGGPYMLSSYVASIVNMPQGIGFNIPPASAKHIYPNRTPSVVWNSTESILATDPAALCNNNVPVNGPPKSNICVPLPLPI